MFDLVIRDGTVIDGTGANPRLVRSVAVSGGSITQLSDAVVDGALSVDAKGRYLLPGLVNMHDHLIYRNVIGLPGNVAHRRAAEVAILGLRNSFDALRRGWTTTVDMASAFETPQVVRDLVDSGNLVGPRILAAGNPICVSAGHASDANTCIVADGPDACRRAARENLGRGADLLKVMASHDPYQGPGGEWTRPEMAADEIEAVFDQARRWGKLTTAHVMGSRSTRDVVEAGVDILHHGAYLEETTALQMREQGTFFCPTLSAYGSKTMDPAFQRGEEWAAAHRNLVNPILDAARTAIEAGVQLVVGTDSTGSFAEDVAMMRTLGLSPMNSLVAATANGARALRLEDVIGTIEVGKQADFVLLDRDPIDDAYALDAVWRVVLAGRLLDPADLRLDRIDSNIWVDS